MLMIGDFDKFMKNCQFRQEHMRHTSSGGGQFYDICLKNKGKECKEKNCKSYKRRCSRYGHEN